MKMMHGPRRADLAGPSPMVGGGFRQGLYDVVAPARAATAITSPGGILSALRHHQERRLGSAAQYAAVSEPATADYLAHAAAGARS